MTYHEDLYMIYRDRLRALREDSDLSENYRGLSRHWSDYLFPIRTWQTFHASRIYYQTLPVL